MVLNNELKHYYSPENYPENYIASGLVLEKALFRAHTLWNKTINTHSPCSCELILSSYFFLRSKERLKYSFMF